MTVETQVNKAQFQGTGSAKIFPLHFPVYAAGDLKVYLGSGSSQQLTTAYQVTGIGGSSLNLVMNTAPAKGELVTVLRVMPLTQGLDLENGGAFHADSIETALDRIVMAMQQINEAVDRCVIAPESHSGLGVSWPDLIGLKNECAASASGAANSQVAAQASETAAQGWAETAEAHYLEGTETFNQNAANKTSAFNTNHENKLLAYNGNAAEKTSTFDDNAAEKQASVDAAALAAQTSEGNAAISAYEAENWARQAQNTVTDGVPDAALDVKGIVFLADGATAAAGTDDKKAVTSKALKEAVGTLVPVASTTVAGKVALANNATAAAGTNTTNAITAAALKHTLSLLLPSGVILLWKGATNAVPSGWALCNGANGTPDLRNRFVIGAGSTYAVNAKAGATTHTHTVSGSTNNHTLTTAQMPSHNHSMDAQIPSSPDQHGTGNYIVNTVQTAPTTLYTHNAGSNHGHAHTISSATAGSASNLPPYYALCYIMKL